MNDINIIANINTGDKDKNPIRFVNITAILIIIIPVVGFHMKEKPATIIINNEINNPVLPNISLAVVIIKFNKSVTSPSKYPYAIPLPSLEDVSQVKVAADKVDVVLQITTKELFENDSCTTNNLPNEVPPVGST